MRSSIHIVYCILVLLFLHRARAVEVFINADDGAITRERPENVGLWCQKSHTDSQCVESLDANYVEHSGRYIVNDWVYTERDFGRVGGVATRATINDLQVFTEYCHTKGVWSPPATCESVWHIMLEHVYKPIAKEAGKQNRGEYMSTMMHGVLIQNLCRHNEMEEYHTCKASEFKAIIHGHGMNKIHKSSSRPGGAQPHA